ncbi:MAG TPA: Gfo/Idh/MocA family oxidoreductase [Tepidisphaeraceae bacterium]|jgi:predicted dehydrogenase|nr:Gfo/Idh/MocA family oxidoreductase [Tepidisphaeraceae bacterium]
MLVSPIIIWEGETPAEPKRSRRRSVGLGRSPALQISLIFFLFPSVACDAGAEPIIRAGIIGLDTSHVIAFTKLLNAPKAREELTGVKIVAAFPGGSSDIPDSRDRVGPYTKQVQAMGVEIVDSIPALLPKVDVVLLESVDGRPHLAQARPVIEAGKPLFIDKPLAGSLADAIAIDELARKHQVPWFSSSSLRFGPKVQAIRHDPKVGQVFGCDAWSPCHLEPHHPDLYWYGIHGVELLYTVMGEGCESVTRVTSDGTDVVVGRWKDGRIGTFRGIRAGKQDYGVVVFGGKGVGTALGFEGYEPLLVQIVKFFKTRAPPVSAAETIEIYAFMEAADESKRQGGRPITISAVMEKATASAKMPER